MTRLYRLTGLILLSAWVFCAGGAAFAELRKEPAQIQAATASPAGILLQVSPGGRAVTWCSVSLTRPDAVLTAFHCISSTHSGDALKVFFPYEGIREVDPGSIRPFCFESDKAGEHRGPEGCSDWTDDLVILGLKTPYFLLQPFKLGDASAARQSSRAGIAGFGYQDEELSNYGVAHGGETVISECEAGGDPAAADSEVNDRALCFRFDGTKSSETRIGPFDSGGPMFSIDAESGEQSLIGVALGSEPVDGSNGAMRMARYVNLTDPFYRDWLAEEAFSANFVPAAYSIETLVEDDVRELQPGKMDEYTLEVRKSSSRLLLTLNHDPGPSLFPNNLDLRLPDNLDAACERHASVEVCSVENPPAGRHRISVGWGELCGPDGECGGPVYDSAYQMTAIALYDNPGTGE